MRCGAFIPPFRSGCLACLGARSALAAGLSTFSFTSLPFPSRPVPQRLSYEARAQAIAAGNLTLPPLTAFVTLRELVHYIDSIFRGDNTNATNAFIQAILLSSAHGIYGVSQLALDFFA